MGMGGSGAAQSADSRIRAAMGAGITDTNELFAIGQGMTPMSYANYQNAKGLALGGKGQPPGAFQDVQKYGLKMSGLANGGLMLKGLSELNSIPQTPSTTPGTINRMSARYGIDASQEHGPNGNLDTSVSDAANRVALNNQVRSSLNNAQMGMRFGGLST